MKVDEILRRGCAKAWAATAVRRDPPDLERRGDVNVSSGRGRVRDDDALSPLKMAPNDSLIALFLAFDNCRSSAVGPR